MCPEMCNWTNEIALAGVSGSFPKLILALVLISLYFNLEMKFLRFTDRWDASLLINVPLKFFFYVLCSNYFISVDKNNPYEVCDLWKFGVGLARGKTQRHGTSFNTLSAHSVQVCLQIKYFKQ